MKKVTVAFLMMAATMFFISCGSKPEPEQEEIPVAPVVEEKKEEIPQEPVQIEVVEEEPEAEPEPEPEPEPVDNSEILSDISDIRDEVIDAGAEEYLPEVLAKLDSVYEALKSETVDVTDKANDLINKYQALLDYLSALELKEEIDENDYAEYNQMAYDRGEAALDEVEEALLRDEVLSEEYLEKAELAFNSFNAVLQSAYKVFAKQERALAYQAKLDADSVKAGIAQKERYNAAAEKFKIGDSCYSMQNPEKAMNYYKMAKNDFTELYKEVSEKRAAAAAAIAAAKKRVEESANFADAADSKSPVTKKIEGIEDEDTVLLEDDVFEDPEKAEVEITEFIDGEEESEEDLILEAIIFDDEESSDEEEE